MLHDILEDFKGSQDGRLTERFLKGSQRDLSDSLAAVAVKEGWARPVTVAPPPAAPASSKKSRTASVSA